MILLIFLISWLGFAQISCEQFIENVNQTVGIVDSQSLATNDLKKAYRALKQQHLAFRDVYVNRTDYKRTMSEQELESVRRSFGIKNLDDENVQTFYANQVEKHMGTLDELFRQQIVDSLNLSDDESN